MGKSKKEKKEEPYKLFRFVIPYSDTVDMAKKILLMYNSYVESTGEKALIDDRHMNLLSYYFVFGYSQETRKKFSHCFSMEMRYISVLDTEMKNRGLLVDPDGNFRTRRLCDDLQNMKRLFIDENDEDRCAVVALFCRKTIFDNIDREEQQ